MSTVVSYRRGLMLIGAAAVAWGIGGAVASVLFRTTGLGPVDVSFWRFAIAATGLIVLRRRRTGAVTWSRSALTGVGLALYQTAYFGSVQEAGLALGTLITLGAGPILIAVGARYALGEPLTRQTVSATLVALAGLALLAGRPGTAGPHPILGIVLALGSAAGYAAMTLLSRAGAGGGATLPVYAFGTLGLLPFAIRDVAVPHELTTAAWLLFLGTVPTLLAYRWFFAGLVAVPAATASIVVLLEPVTAAVIAVGLLGEHLTGPAAAGAVLLLAAIALLARGSARDAVEMTSATAAKRE